MLPTKFWAEMSWRDFAAADMSKVVAVLPVAAKLLLQAEGDVGDVIVRGRFDFGPKLASLPVFFYRFLSRAVISKYSFRGKATLRMWKSFLLSPTHPKQ